MNYFDNENNIEFDKKIKVLGLALYGERAASARVRLSQYIEPLLEKNIEMESKLNNDENLISTINSIKLITNFLNFRIRNLIKV